MCSYIYLTHRVIEVSTISLKMVIFLVFFSTLEVKNIPMYYDTIFWKLIDIDKYNLIFKCTMKQYY